MLVFTFLWLAVFCHDPPRSMTASILRLQHNIETRSQPRKDIETRSRSPPGKDFETRLPGLTIDMHPRKASILFIKEDAPMVGRLQPSKTTMETQNIPTSPTASQHNLFQDGFQVVEIDDKDFLETIEDLKKSSLNEKADQRDSTPVKLSDTAFARFNDFMRRKLTELGFAGDVRCVNSAVARNSRANPAKLLHLDFYDLAEYPYNVYVKEFNDFQPDFVVNLWLPTNDENIQNWNLAFLEKKYFERKDIQTFTDLKQYKLPVSGSIRGSVLKRGAQIVYEPEMKWGKAYMFLSGSQNQEHIPMHGAIDFGPDIPFVRGSIEVRCLYRRPDNQT